MFPVRTILHATDFSPRSAYAFQIACALASDYAARLLVVHVYPFPSYGSLEMPMIVPDPAEIEAGLSKQLAAVRPADADLCVEHRLCCGAPAEEILRLARESNSDLIVMGTHGRSGLGRLLLGSVAEAVLRKAPCPVLTVKAPAAEATTTPAAPALEVAQT
jgi:nucleotide-binding universal stress UspA family protein